MPLPGPLGVFMAPAWRRDEVDECQRIDAEVGKVEACGGR
jgi:hypothetical protein